MTLQNTRRTAGFVAFLFWFFAAVSTSWLPAQERAAPRTIREFRGKTMGTTYMVKVAGADEVDDQTLRFSIDAELRLVNDQMSTYLKSSEISRFNQTETTEWFNVSSEFAMVVQAAQEISAKTDGAFDISIGPLVNAWSFGTTERTQTVPDPATLQKLMGSIGYKKLEVRTEPPSLRKLIPELQIDLSSIAKGHGVDRVVERLSELGVKDVFVEVGGELRTAGDKPGGAWKVGIQMPDAASDTVMIAHPMLKNDAAGNAMATSGDYRNLFVADGKRYSHTIDPRTGAPVEHDLASVTVIAKNCMEADGWATALNVLGKDAGLKVATKHGIHTLLISRTSPTEFQKVGTGILAQYAQTAPEPAEATSWISAVVPIAILTFGVFSILLFAMAIGVVFGRKSISGSCGGLNSKTNPDGSTSCSLCSSPSNACKELREKMTEKQTQT